MLQEDPSNATDDALSGGATIGHRSDDGNGLHHLLPSFVKALVTGGADGDDVSDGLVTLDTSVEPLPPVILPTGDGEDNLHVRRMMEALCGFSNICFLPKVHDSSIISI